MGIASATNDDILPTLTPVAIGLLGLFRLLLAGKPAPIGSESKAAHLLLCLALARPHRLPRLQLLERLWPQADPALATQSLNSVVYSLHKFTRSALGGKELVVHEHGDYQLNMDSGLSIDLDQFEAWHGLGTQLLSQGDGREGVGYCRQALALYRGDLCGGDDLQTVIERERLHVAFLDLLVRLASHHYAQGNPGQALPYLQRLIAHDPCREDAHRLAMRCYMQIGQRAQALRQFRVCCRALILEFDAQPEPATVALFEQVRLNPASL
jgi:DNA-binding SARP family transcriptional activator